MSFDEVISEDGIPVRLKMVKFIQANFSEELGPDMLLLDQPGGLERLKVKYREFSSLKS